MATLVIPARYGSKRLPGKPLLRETGKPLVVHVLERALEARHVSRALVATDDERIRDAVIAAGGEAVMTGAGHRNGTERIGEVAAGLPHEDHFVNLQGDEPEIDPADIDLLVTTLVESGAPVATLAAPLEAEAEFLDPAVVKVVLDRESRAIYFSRAPIPFPRDGGGPAGALRHVGIYGFTRDALLGYPGLPVSALEGTERLEQLRFLEAGIAVRVALVERAPAGIDTIQGYRAFVKRHGLGERG